MRFAPVVHYRRGAACFLQDTVLGLEREVEISVGKWKLGCSDLRDQDA